MASKLPLYGRGRQGVRYYLCKGELLRMKTKSNWLTVTVLAAALVLGGQISCAATPASSAGMAKSGAHHRLAFDWLSDLLNWLEGQNSGGNGGTTSVPEPATMGLLLVGLGGVVAARRRKA